MWHTIDVTWLGKDYKRRFLLCEFFTIMVKLPGWILVFSSHSHRAPRMGHNRCSTSSNEACLFRIMIEIKSLCSRPEPFMVGIQTQVLMGASPALRHWVFLLSHLCVALEFDPDCLLDINVKYYIFCVGFISQWLYMPSKCSIACMHSYQFKMICFV